MNAAAPTHNEMITRRRQPWPALEIARYKPRSARAKRPQALVVRHRGRQVASISGQRFDSN